MGIWHSSSAYTQQQVEEIVSRLETQRIERQIALEQAIQARRRAFELAREREALLWWASGGAVTAVFAILSSYHHKNLSHLLPLAPMTSFIGYKAHLCYGGKLDLINEQVKELVKYDSDSISVAPINAEDVRRRMKELTTERVDV